MVEIVKYKPEHKEVWDAFVAASKNGTFLFFRDYMAYHADRFTDHSLLFYRKGKLIALLPANEAGNHIESHGGLTYGGIVSDRQMRAAIMLEIIGQLRLYFQKLGFLKLHYKAIPSIYHQAPAEEDLYALFRNDAILYRRDLASVVALNQPLPYNTLRKRKLKAAERYHISLGQSTDFASFMALEQELLQQKYRVSPVHTAAEISNLAASFPDNIKLYMATETGGILAGVLLYETPAVAHCQYIGTSQRGRDIGGLDVLIHYLLTAVYCHKAYLSFGISTEQQGQVLNENLVANKESYGARSVVHDFYTLSLS